MERFEVVVVGAGLAGLWCARALARRGVRTLLVDCKASVEGAVRTSGIFVRDTLEAFDLPPGVLGRPIRRVVLHSPTRRRLVIESSRDEFSVADMRALNRTLLTEGVALGVTWWPASPYLGLQCLERSLLVRIGRTHVQARYIVGADGARSRVARDLGLSRNRRLLLGVEDIYEDVPAASQSTLHCFLDPCLAPGYIAWIIHQGTSVHIGTAGAVGRFHARAALDRFVREASTIVDLRAARRAETRAGLIPVGGPLPHVACSRGLLIGDSAGGPSPLTAGGLDPCLRHAEHAADALADRATPLADVPCRRRPLAQAGPRLLLRALLERASPLALELAHAVMRAPVCSGIPARIFFADPATSAQSNT